MHNVRDQSDIVKAIVAHGSDPVLNLKVQFG